MLWAMSRTLWLSSSDAAAIEPMTLSVSVDTDEAAEVMRLASDIELMTPPRSPWIAWPSWSLRWRRRTVSLMSVANLTTLTTLPAASRIGL